MTLDERLEALTQSVELIAATQTDNERRTRMGFETLTSLHADNERRMGQLMETMNHLGRIVENHEQRIEHLEDRSA
jgi:hypothetical protein